MEDRREYASQRKAQRRAREAAAREAQAAHDAAIEKALYRPTLPLKNRIDRFIENATTPWGQRRPYDGDPILDSLDVRNLTDDFFEVVRIVEERAPKLMDKDYVQALVWVCKVPHVTKQPFVRPPSEWKPRGKGRDTIFRSLVEHLLAKYPVPAMLWSVFFDRQQAYILLALVGHVAAGGSLYDYVTGKVGVREEFPVPLTRKMCHELLAYRGPDSLVAAIRRTQVRAAGGTDRLFQAIIGHRHYQTLATKSVEAFMATVIEWLAKNPMLNPTEIGPLLDYIAHRRAEDTSFSMKGRSVIAMMRAMHAWHDGLTRARSISKTVFRESGFKPIEIELHRKDSGQVIPELWRVQEILTGRQLADEGRRMSHCVYSYESACLRGHTSIWSMTMEDGQGDTGNWAMLTVEVNNVTRTIVQARGRFNRVATAREHSILVKWAQANNLTISLGRWG